MNTTWKFYLSPEATWNAMLHDCASATHSIFLEQYIFEDDVVGCNFMRVFIERARKGVSVTLLCDEVGSRTLRSSPLVAEFRASGGHIHFYNSLRWIDLLKPRRIFPRTHVKTLVVDTTFAFVGGVCISRRMENWRDTQIRITGPVVSRIEEIARCNFNGAPIPKQSSELLTEDFSYLQSGPKFFRHPIYEVLLHAIDQAKDFIYMSSAFFVPSRRLRRSLKRASRQGVTVIVLVPIRSDSHIADLACLSYAKKLLKAGVRIFQYQPTIFHSKTVIIDGHWGTVGSTNMDMLSFFHNREANIFIQNTDALIEMKGDFLNDLKNSSELTSISLDAFPLWKKVAIHATRVFHSLL
jgi:cardiolipin synthase